MSGVLAYLDGKDQVPVSYIRPFPVVLAPASGQNSGSMQAAPYAFTPLSPGQHGLAITSAQRLTAPAGATFAVVQANGGNVKYTTDNTTTPTASVGMTLLAGNTLTLSGAAVIAAFQAISSSGTLDVEFYT